ncbi:hypothetical protein ACFV4G_29770 [Kitasatospora sp. NPDC059747]|uniref:hypothetical protein n=1 Tax=Kitasatospora sp. NPDC059747 TaxID=3346930 RepID=UPI003664E537
MAAFSKMAKRMAIDAAVSVRQLRRWESPDPPLPHPGQQVVIEAMLGVPLSELGFAVPLERARGGLMSGHHEDVHRRQFVVEVGAILGATVLPAARGRRIGASDVQLLQSQVSGLYAIDHSQGGQVAQKAALQVLRQVEKAMTDGSYLERIGRELHVLSGTLHSHLGWIEFDAGRPAQARAACTEALTSARLVGDPLLEVRALDKLSMLAVEQRRPWEAVAAANAAGKLAQTHGSPKVRSVVALRLARALSASGDHASARRALSLALTWHDRSDKDTEAPRWTAFAGQVEVDYATAAWHVENGRPFHAIPFLRSAVSQLGPTYSRNAALYRARLAEVLMKAGAVEEACAEACASADAAQGMTSARLVERLRTVAAFAELIDSAVTRDFVEHMREFGVTANKGEAA